MADNRLQRQLAAARREAAAAKKVGEANSAAQNAQIKQLQAEKALQNLQHQSEQQTASKVGLGFVKNATMAVPIAGGLIGGWKIASKIGAKHAQSQVLNVQRFHAVASQVRSITASHPKGTITGTVRGDKLGALVKEGFNLGGVKSGIGPGGKVMPKVSDKALFRKAGGSSGLALVVPLAVEGAITSFVLPKYVDMPDSAKEASRWTGSASIAAALSLKTKRTMDKQSAALQPKSTAIADVMGARDRLLREASKVTGAAPVVPPASGFRQNLGRTLARSVSIAAPVIAGAATFEAVRNSALAAGDSSSTANIKATGAGVAAGTAVAGMAFGTVKASQALTKALPAAGRVLSRVVPAAGIAMGVYEAVKGYRSGGVKGAAEGVANFATFGGYNWAKGRLSAPGSDRMSSARMTIARTSAARSNYEAKFGGLSRGYGARAVRSDGQTKGYTRIQGGKSVTVRGYRTPTR